MLRSIPVHVDDEVLAGRLGDLSIDAAVCGVIGESVVGTGFTNVRGEPAFLGNRGQRILVAVDRNRERGIVPFPAEVLNEELL